jgi:Uncharacterised nucleotidyltransferase
MTATLPGIVDEAERLLGAASGAGTTLALLGGVAVRLNAGEIPPALDREYKDIDFAVPKGGGAAASRLLSEQGYEPSVAFNAMNGRERMLFHDPDHGRQIDLFIGSFRMCHEIPFGDRLRSDQQTVPLAELLLTKLQVIELNEKDVRDTALLFYGHEVADRDGDAINGKRIAELCSGDWGLWRTITQNLERCREHLADYELPHEDAKRISDRLTDLLARIEAHPKSRGWKLRAKVGERKRWYELPEEVDR